MRNTQSGGGEAGRKRKEREEDIEKEGMERGRRKRDPELLVHSANTFNGWGLSQKLKILSRSQHE